ncbi:MAG: lipopolysaccharide heptosyltransferase II [Flavisolibacter sp.]
MRILVRLPNWLGDMVMSAAFIKQLPFYYPNAEISLIVKSGIHDLLPMFPQVQNQFIFIKQENKGPRGLLRFGERIRKTAAYDLFFCLPNSFSSALMGFSTGSKIRIGYKNEFRQMLLTHSYKKPDRLHRVDGYIHLLELYAGSKSLPADPSLNLSTAKSDHIVVNINSEASSRRLTASKAIELLNLLRQTIANKIYLIGASKEKPFVEYVLSQLKFKQDIESLAGKTSLQELGMVLASARAMLSTDSGPAHYSNALGTFTIVLFGAGNEKYTAPYNTNLLKIIRLGKLTCEPCEKNVCVRYQTPQCLERLDTHMIIKTLQTYLENQWK